MYHPHDMAPLSLEQMSFNMGVCFLLWLVAVSAISGQTDIPTFTADMITIPELVVDPNDPKLKEVPTDVDADLTYIIGGSRAKQGAHPFICLLKYRYPNGQVGFCGSIVYNRHTILTAAHCVEPLHVDRLEVTCGEHNYKVDEGTEQKRKIISGVVHPLYNETILINDIAMLEVATPLDFTSKSVQPIRLARGNEQSLKNPCKLIGWGRIHPTDPKGFDSVLKETDSYRMPYDLCKGAYWGDLVTDKMMCFINVGGNTSICNGDSGGPAVCSGQLVGVTSFGVIGCPVWAPQVYTRTSSYDKWMKQTAWPRNVGSGSSSEEDD